MSWRDWEKESAQECGCLGGGTFIEENDSVSVCTFHRCNIDSVFILQFTCEDYAQVVSVFVEEGAALRTWQKARLNMGLGVEGIDPYDNGRNLEVNRDGKTCWLEKRELSH